PRVFESPLCPVCMAVSDSTNHLFFHCPSKEKIWQGVIFEFLWPTTSTADIQEALLSLYFSNIRYCQLKGITPYRIILISLSQIWLAHMRFIFDKTIIHPAAILTISDPMFDRPLRKINVILSGRLLLYFLSFRVLFYSLFNSYFHYPLNCTHLFPMTIYS
ncbi:hypothetical protein BD408DRAFT_355611, partial [Parasitella parasitica]